MSIRYGYPLTLAAIWFAAGAIAVVIWTAKLEPAAAEPHCNVIHKPKTGCPPGWDLARRLFQERDGSAEDGCVTPPRGEIESCIDAIYPGERVGLQLEIVPAPATEPEEDPEI